MADSIPASNAKVDADGRVTYAYPQGLDLVAGVNAAPPAASRVRWIRASDGATIAEIFGYQDGSNRPQLVVGVADLGLARIHWRAGGVPIGDLYGDNGAGELRLSGAIGLAFLDGESDPKSFGIDGGSGALRWGDGVGPPDCVFGRVGPGLVGAAGFGIESDTGVLRWGDGVNPPDCGFGRIGADLVGSSPGDKLIAYGGLGVGNNEFAAGGVSTLVGKMQVFDESGAALGYVPIYQFVGI